jgi:hypothetical protein
MGAEGPSGIVESRLRYAQWDSVLKLKNPEGREKPGIYA